MGLTDLVFWIKISIGGKEYLGVLDTRAAISIVAKNILPVGMMQNTIPTVVLQQGEELLLQALLAYPGDTIWEPQIQ